MPSVEKRTISLPAEQAGFIDAQVAAGCYASASEVVRAGLRALQEQVTVASWRDERALAGECGRQARLIRDSETTASRLDGEVWFTASDRAGWTA